jgi:hypothetical protein
LRIILGLLTGNGRYYGNNNDSAQLLLIQVKNIGPGAATIGAE